MNKADTERESFPAVSGSGKRDHSFQRELLGYFICALIIGSICGWLMLDWRRNLQQYKKQVDEEKRNLILNLEEEKKKMLLAFEEERKRLLSALNEKLKTEKERLHWENDDEIRRLEFALENEKNKSAKQRLRWEKEKAQMRSYGGDEYYYYVYDNPLRSTRVRYRHRGGSRRYR